MKPFKSGTVIAAWLFRVTLLLYAYLHYFKTFTNFDLKTFGFYIALAYLLFTVLLIIGGFMKQAGLTVISGLILFAIPIVQIIREFPIDYKEQLFIFLIPLSIGFYFFSNGNSN